ncbi:ATP-binding cassette domain-containing protein [Nonomuraea phyllanthi]|uniref:ABC transporter ATP-binding protein n=1 Tax=Nonomuraea phyllanthi TaxID=2219224 RepID=UPI0012932AA9|nr:ABC transporter ATP-binding protein [Nonomuraea phyllanthi]QFY05788.1 ATP-binding cassette domain-containing protein [Nonomuraea phyllanthi]
MTNQDPPILLDVAGLTVEYGSGDDAVRAVDDVSFQLRRGEILGVAGESGSGKSTLMTALTRLQRPPARIAGGTVTYHPGGAEAGIDLLAVPPARLRELRWDSLAVVLQSAMAALNPVMRLGAQFADVIRAHRSVGRKDAWSRAEELLELVGIPANRVRSYPHELSGGMRQRATIALALACEPEIIVMDEPTTAVDVVMQRQIVRRLMRLRRQFGFAIVFVTHDLSLLVELADRIMVMYAGRIVEIGSASAIYHDPRHPYSQGLRDSFPPLHGPLRELRGIPGSPPDLRALPSGCAFQPRCPKRQPECSASRPALPLEVEHGAACLLQRPADQTRLPASKAVQ